MKVITIKDPYASLIASGIKKYEFRTWKTNYRGELLIHAGVGKDLKAIKEFGKYNLNYSNGYIIAKAVLTDCIKVDNEFRKKLRQENVLVYKNVIEDKSFNGYAFKLENVERIRPVFVKGKLSLWNYDEREKQLTKV